MRIRVFLSLLTMAFAATAAPIDYQISYTLNLGGGTLNGNPVTSVAVFETDGSRVFLEFLPSLGVSGLQYLTHKSPFLPTETLIVGLDLNTPLPGDGKPHVLFFTNPTFAQNATGVLFSRAFPNTRHNDFINRLLAAESGDVLQKEWLLAFFSKGDGVAARFATAGPNTAIEFTAGVPLVTPEPGSAALLLGAFGALALRRWRR